MITVNNNTENVVVICNRYCRKEIPIGKSVVFSDNDISGDYLFEVKYFSLRGEKTHLEASTKSRSGKTYSFAIHESRFPLTATVRFKDGSVIDLNDTEKNVITVPLFFKRILLNSVSCVENGNKRVAAQYSYANKKDKISFLCMLSAVLLFLLVISSCLMATSFIAIHKGIEGSIWGAAFSAIGAILFAYNLHLLVSAGVWEVDTTAPPVFVAERKIERLKPVIVVAGGIIVVLLSMLIAWFIRDVPSEGCIMVNNKEFPGIRALIYQEYVEMPFVPFIENFGGTVTWSGESAKIVYNSKEYLLNIGDKITFTESHNKLNYFYKSPDNENYVCKAKGNEVILDSKTFDLVFSMMGTPIDINIDHDNMIVSVDRYLTE